ncbi:efflux RND transporter permease subunit [Erwinia sp. BNK-24-a]|nr:efflux RND transporter permease subunit [Erwinia phyllosphaerae]MBV4367441.1 efflux RND transporter permease subunit [Erwinia phyllosphaerae]
MLSISPRALTRYLPLLLVRRWRDGYGWVSTKINRYAATTAIVMLAAGAVTWFGYQQLTGGFVAQEEEGYLLISVQLPDSAVLPITQQVMEQMYKVINKNPAFEDVMKIGDYGR